jgi:hypothetical protein
VAPDQALQAFVEILPRAFDAGGPTICVDRMAREA